MSASDAATAAAASPTVTRHESMNIEGWIDALERHKFGKGDQLVVDVGTLGIMASMLKIVIGQTYPHLPVTAIANATVAAGFKDISDGPGPDLDKGINWFIHTGAIDLLKKLADDGVRVIVIARCNGNDGGNRKIWRAFLDELGLQKVVLADAKGTTPLEAIDVGTEAGAGTEKPIDFSAKTIFTGEDFEDGEAAQQKLVSGGFHYVPTNLAMRIVGVAAAQAGVAAAGRV